MPSGVLVVPVIIFDSCLPPELHARLLRGCGGAFKAVWILVADDPLPLLVDISSPCKAPPLAVTVCMPHALIATLITKDGPLAISVGVIAPHLKMRQTAYTRRSAAQGPFFAR